MNKHHSTLYAFSGLPGVGKSTLAQSFCQFVKALYLRIDTIEQQLREKCGLVVQAEGYDLAYAIASENLQLGQDVIADSCNPVELTRRHWQHIALQSQAQLINVEIICSDKLEHQYRVETRQSTVPGLTLPKWDDVLQREYHPWQTARILIDTAGKSPEKSLNELIDKWRKY